MDSQCVFVYGTLMSGNQEHNAFCGTPLSIKPASISGALYQLGEGYPILRIDQRQIIRPTTKTQPDQASTTQNGSHEFSQRHSPIFGELLEYPSDYDFLPKMDEWEGYAPEGNSLYQRYLCHCQPIDASASVVCWVYATTAAPLNAIKLETDRWQRPDWLAFQ